MLSVRLHFVRHGQSADNARNRLQGHADPPLTDLGRAEAERLRPALPPFAADRVVSSDLLRARDTAALLGYPEARLDPRLREIHVGSWGGRSLAELPPGSEPAWRGGPLRAPDGESWAELQARVGGVVDELLAAGGEWLVVCHGGVVRAALSHITGADPQRVAGPANASLTVIHDARLTLYGWVPTF